MTRITNSMLYRFAVSNTQEQRARLAVTQEQSSTGKVLNRPSDDPVKVRAATLIRDGIEKVDQFRQNIVASRLRISTTETAVGGAFDIMVRAGELAVDGANGTQNAASRKDIAKEVEQLHAQLLREGNARDAGGGRVFAGYANSSDPFAVSGAFVSGAPPPTVTFTGDPTEVRVGVDDGVDLQVTLRGDRVFSGAGGGENLFSILEDFWQALDSNNQKAIGNVTDRLKTAQTQLSSERTAIGSSDALAELSENRHLDRNTMLQDQLSRLEDADSIEVFSDLVQQQGALQGTIEVTSRILQTNLLSFL